MLPISALLSLLCLLQPAPRFEAQVIDDRVSIGYGLAIGDVDGDKKPDILLADKTQIVWYRNGDWKRIVMAENLTQHDNVCIAARDIDGDGKVEVAVGAQWNPGETGDTAQSGAVFYLHRPADPTQRWRPQALHHEPTVHRMRWVQASPGRYRLVVAPLHGRHNSNGQGAGVRIMAYAPPQGSQREWTYEMIDSSLHMTHNFEVVEEKQGARLLLGGREGIKEVRWNGKDWSPTGKWFAREGTGEVRLGHYSNSTPFIAAIGPMHGNKAQVFGSDGQLQRLLTDQLAQGHALACHDLLGLGNTQVVAGWRNRDAQQQTGILLFIPRNNGGEWDRHQIDRNTMACEDLQVADLNGDNKAEIIASGRDSHNVIIYWNRS
jgi:hypothetical protein